MNKTFCEKGRCENGCLALKEFISKVLEGSLLVSWLVALLEYFVLFLHFTQSFSVDYLSGSMILF